jgi:biopolymer transport protein TolR
MKRKAHPHEHEAEINLVPYLDIMVNLVMFMLVSMATATLAVVNVNMPDLSDGSASADPSTPQPEKPEDKLTLNVSIGGNGFFVAATGGLLPSEVPTGDKVNDQAPPTIPCKTRSELGLDKKEPKPAEVECGSSPGKYYDYEGLTLLMTKVKKAYPKESSYFLAANASVRYDAIVQAMDATRGPVPCELVGGSGEKCSLFPDVAFAAVQ